jgi:hypothetical protein
VFFGFSLVENLINNRELCELGRFADASRRLAGPTGGLPSFATKGAANYAR